MVVSIPGYQAVMMTDHHPGHKHLTTVCIIIIAILVLSNVSTIVKYNDISTRIKRETVEVSVEKQNEFIQGLLNQTPKPPHEQHFKKETLQREV